MIMLLTEELLSIIFLGVLLLLLLLAVLTILVMILICTLQSFMEPCNHYRMLTFNRIVWVHHSFIEGVHSVDNVFV